MKIEWDNNERYPRNRGTDGEGLIASYETLDDEDQRTINLDFIFYADDSIQDCKLSQLCQTIGSLIHNHLGSAKEEFDLQCPNCKNEGKTSEDQPPILHMEWTPVFRPIKQVGGTLVHLHFDKAFDIPENSRDPHFHCSSCEHEWPVPSYLTIT